MSESFLSRWARLKRGEPGSTGESSEPLETGSALTPVDRAARDPKPEAPGHSERENESAVPDAPTGSPLGSSAPADTQPASASTEVDVEPAAKLPTGEPELPPLETLTPQSDFRPFLRAGVAPQTRNAALKTLFADPHFNVMDGLDVYIDDYNLTTPLPESTVRRLAHARTLRLFDDLPEAEPTPEASDIAGRPAAPEASPGGSQTAPQRIPESAPDAVADAAREAAPEQAPQAAAEAVDPANPESNLPAVSTASGSRHNDGLAPPAMTKPS